MSMKPNQIKRATIEQKRRLEDACHSVLDAIHAEVDCQCPVCIMANAMMWIVVTHCQDSKVKLEEIGDSFAAAVLGFMASANLRTEDELAILGTVQSTLRKELILRAPNGGKRP